MDGFKTTNRKGKTVMAYIKKDRGRTVYLSKKGNPDAAKWVTWLEENCQASAGPRPNLCGMRRMYWGDKALIVKCGLYAYLITSHDDGRRLPWE